MFVERFEYRKIGKRSSAGSLKVAEGRAEMALGTTGRIQFTHLEAAKQRLEHRPLASGDRGIIDEPSRARGGEGRREPTPSDQLAHRFILGKAGHGGDVDIKKIEPAAA